MQSMSLMLNTGDSLVTDSTGDILTLTTDKNGMYMAKLPVGPASMDIVESTLPPGYKQTARVDPMTAAIPLNGTATDLDGYQILGKVKGIIFEDLNFNGVQDPGEPSIAGVDVVITDSNGEMLTLTSTTRLVCTWLRFL